MGAVKLPREIGGYEFQELLGTGSFGAVYRACLRGELGFEQEVAIKVLDSARAHLDKRLIASLANEARILSRVQHPNIVQARHFIAISDAALGETYALVMELVRGQPLRKLLGADRKAQRPLPIQAPLQAISEVSDALHFAHRLTDDDGKAVGLVHRDLKPENIHVTNEGRMKVLDFGIAWAKHRLGEATAGGWTKGTPSYMSPEQIRGEPLDSRSDLYALGAIAFEMLAGERYVPQEPDPDPLGPATQVRFSGREPLLLEALHRRYDLDPRSEPVRELVSLLRDLLARERARRPARAGEVFDRLEDLATLHRPSKGRGHLRRWVARQNERERRGLELPDAEDGDHRPVQPVRETVVLRRPSGEHRSISESGQERPWNPVDTEPRPRRPVPGQQDGEITGGEEDVDEERIDTPIVVAVPASPPFADPPPSARKRVDARPDDGGETPPDLSTPRGSQPHPPPPSLNRTEELPALDTRGPLDLLPWLVGAALAVALLALALAFLLD